MFSWRFADLFTTKREIAFTLWGNFWDSLDSTSKNWTAWTGRVNVLILFGYGKSAEKANFFVWCWTFGSLFCCTGSGFIFYAVFKTIRTIYRSRKLLFGCNNKLSIFSATARKKRDLRVFLARLLEFHMFVLSYFKDKTHSRFAFRNRLALADYNECPLFCCIRGSTSSLVLFPINLSQRLMNFLASHMLIQFFIVKCVLFPA